MANVVGVNPINQINRVQNLKAMERIMLAFDGKRGLMAWLDALPDDVILDQNGCVSKESLFAIATIEKDYIQVACAFAEHMAPVLLKISDEK